MPSIDVIIPNYQYARYLPACIGSVLSQDVENLRVLVIDNASTDDSLEVARALAATDARIRIIAHPVNVGVVASFNEGIDEAQADYFTILCADDMLTPGSLKRAISILEKNPAVSVAQGRGHIVSAGNAVPDELSAAEPAVWTVVPGPAFIENICRHPRQGFVDFTVVRTTIQKRAGHYRKDLPFTCDREMLMQLAALGDVARTDTIQGIQQEHSNNISSAYWQDFRLFLESLYGAIDKFLSTGAMDGSQSDRLRALARASLARDAYWSAVSHLVRAKYREAAGLFRLAFGLLPRLAILPPLGHLFRTKGVLSRAREIFVEASGRS
ncbi:MAG: glycosyltransferase family 2 protein [Mesorhizobium sp.]